MEELTDTENLLMSRIDERILGAKIDTMGSTVAESSHSSACSGGRRYAGTIALDIPKRWGPGCPQGERGTPASSKSSFACDVAKSAPHSVAQRQAVGQGEDAVAGPPESPLARADRLVNQKGYPPMYGKERFPKYEGAKDGRCVRLRGNGGRCPLAAMEGLDECERHFRWYTKLPPLVAMPYPDDAVALQDVMARTVAMVLNREISPQIAQAVGALCKVMQKNLRAYEDEIREMSRETDPWLRVREVVV